MFKVNLNHKSYHIDLQDNEILVDGELLSWDVVAMGDQLFNLIKDSKSYVLEVTASDANKKHLKLKVNGVPFEAVVQDKYDLLLEKLGMQQSNNTNHHEIRAPMPGMILDVLVKEGQIVSKGEKLIILEAMKMENIIKSTGEGTIESIHIQQGMNVEKNQVLIQF